MKTAVLLTFLIVTQTLFAQHLAQFSVVVNEDRMNTPISVSLDGLNYNTDKGELALYELEGNKEVAIPCQLESGHSARLWFLLNGETKAGTTRKFVLKAVEETKKTEAFVGLKKDNEDLCLHLGEKSILKYRYAVTLPPKEADPLYKRSGYIHPLSSPGGKVLTRIQAPDHYHHYGIWGPWTKTHIDDRAVDFWNLKAGQGTVKFAGFLAENEGTVFSGFKALQQHIDFGCPGEDQIAMNEILDVRAWNIGDGVWMVDYTTSLNSPLKNGIMLDAYRYGGGIGFRATETWHKDNCTVLTSDGKTRIDADGSYARWCLVEGESNVAEGRSGILFMSHPSNRMHPEPMRVWPLDANGGRGDMYFEFVPIRHDDWKINPKQTYTLKYRMIIFDGNITAEAAEKYWNSFASNPLVSFN
ncbi:PmoA family protein [uncultured Draconibacterium sp.]|uniref:DUF6807 domain-containing protein n=1 Tax=uncultured Draconibacterium sp. TaxID=1573823 RepID=UPI0032618562